MKILILGAGKMGSFFVDLLSFDHETAVYEVNAAKLRFMYNTQRFTSLEEVEAFKPELVINAVTLDHTIEVFETVTPYLPKDCIISDIAIWDNSATRMPSLSVRVTIWDAYSLRIFICGWD